MVRLMRFCLSLLLFATTSIVLVGAKTAAAAAAAAADNNDENHKRRTDVVSGPPRLRSSSSSLLSSQRINVYDDDDDDEEDEEDEDEEDRFDSRQLQEQEQKLQLQFQKLQLQQLNPKEQEQQKEQQKEQEEKQKEQQATQKPKPKFKREKWWARYKLEFGTTKLKLCGNFRGVPPASGRRCSKRNNPRSYGYFCMFGRRKCLSPRFGWVHPKIKCDCLDGKWDCNDWDPECTDGDSPIKLPKDKTPSLVPCDANADCATCIESGCAWAADGCLDDCDQIADVGCHTKENSQDRTSEEICQIEQDRVDDSAACEVRTTCADCVGTNLPSDADKTCMWHEEMRSCRSSCGQFGCGVAECPVRPAPVPGTIRPLLGRPLDPLRPLPVNPFPIVPAIPPDSVDGIISLTCEASDCLDCVSRGCGWAVGSSCLSDCRFMADDEPCYSLAYHGDGNKKTPTEVCQIEQDDKDNSFACSEGKTCEECVAIGLPAPDPNRKNCLWVSFGNTGGLCQSSCGMLGCGSSTCVAPEIVEP